MTDCVLTVFFEGTSNPLFDDDSNITTQLGLFFGLVRAEDLSDPITTPDDDETSFKMGFDGCGVAFGACGTIWAVGLSSQCAAVEARDPVRHRTCPQSNPAVEPCLKPRVSTPWRPLAPPGSWRITFKISRATI